jgi:DNA-binding NtrC family response regulator
MKNIIIPKDHKVLIVEDDVSFARSLEKHLNNEFNISTVMDPTGEEALKRIDKDKSIWAAILDLSLPGIGGTILLRKILEKNSKIKIIVVTGKGDTELAVQCMYFGAFWYLDKPIIDYAELAAWLEKAWQELMKPKEK